MDAVARLLHLQGLGPAGQGELAGRVRPARGRDTRPATLPTLTIPLGAERRSSGSRASVSRTWASKLVAMTRRTSAQPPSAKLPAADAGVVDQQVQAPVLGLDPLGDQRRGRLLDQVGGDHGGPAQLGGQRLQPFAAPGHQHQAGVRLGGQAGAPWPPRSRWRRP